MHASFNRLFCVDGFHVVSGLHLSFYLNLGKIVKFFSILRVLK